MNQKNLEYLQEGLKYLGFGEGLNERLKEEIGKGKPEFQLNTINEYGRDKVSYTLDFRKSDSSDMYFFNKYAATFKPQNSEERNQTFYVKKNAGITAKEAYNLLSGRAVNKDLTNAEGQPYNAWLQIDWNQKDNHGNHKFKMIHEAYGFKLEDALKKHPIKELQDETTKDRLMQSLERGNLHQVTFQTGDKEEKMFIEANPQYKSLNVFDSSSKKVFQENPGRYHVPESGPMKRQPDGENQSVEANIASKDSKVDNGKEVSMPKESQKQSAAADEPDEALISQKKHPKKRMKA